MNTRFVETFVAVAQLHSFRAAAGTLHANDLSHLSARFPTLVVDFAIDTGAK